VSFLAFFLIVVSLVSFVAAQLILKQAMAATTRTDFRNAQFVSKVTSSVILMTISFFLTLGLLQRLSLSIPGFERDLHHADGSGRAKREAKHPTGGWRVADQRRDRARFT
jgi:ABC-type uncharacterized transport system YnjBCD permease subunit